jgi:aminopeptidase YwaD
LRLRSVAQPGRAANVIGRRTHLSHDKLVLCAHFDTKPGTPGALDNAAGVATVLALAQRLAADPPANLEFVFFNGEDHYAAPGEVVYLSGSGGEFGRIALVVNIDGVGLSGAGTTVAFFNCPDAWADAARATLHRRSNVTEAEPWPQGDHSIFAMQGVPCIALTSGGIHSLIDSLIHTPSDTLDRLDPAEMAAAVDFLVELLAQPLPRRA